MNAHQEHTTGRMNVDFKTESRNTWLENVKHYYWNPFRYYTNYEHFSLFGQRFIYLYTFIQSPHIALSLNSTDWLTNSDIQFKRPNKILSLFVVSSLLLLLLFDSPLCSVCDSDFINTYTIVTHTYGRHLTLACHLISTFYSILYVCVPFNWIRWSLWFCWLYYQ